MITLKRVVGFGAVIFVFILVVWGIGNSHLDVQQTERDLSEAMLVRISATATFTFILVLTGLGIGNFCLKSQQAERDPFGTVLFRINAAAAAAFIVGVVMWGMENSTLKVRQAERDRLEAVLWRINAAAASSSGGTDRALTTEVLLANNRISRDDYFTINDVGHFIVETTGKVPSPGKPFAAGKTRVPVGDTKPEIVPKDAPSELRLALEQKKLPPRLPREILVFSEE